MSLFPIITRPSRITSYCATLIDNIFTNNIENNTVNGLLIIDISDHLPVFTVYDCKYRINKPDKQTEFRRVRSEESINRLKKDLLAQNWDIIYQEKDINKAYDIFLELFKYVYDKNCPIKEYSRKLRHTNCPWITKGIQNACKKKNTLYREFIRWGTKEKENKYKKYKNNLTQIIRACKRVL